MFPLPISVKTTGLLPCFSLTPFAQALYTDLKNHSIEQIQIQYKIMITVLMVIITLSIRLYQY